MHDQLITFIQKHSKTPLKRNEIQQIKSAFVSKTLKRKESFLLKGKVCKYLGFIVKGAMRQFSIDENGVEHIVRLSIDNSWVNDRESFMMGIPSSYYIDSWKETRLLIITKANLDKLMLIPAIMEASICLDEFFALQKRVHTSISLSALERYKDLERTNPELINRFPQHIIASYLGVNKATLSRALNQVHKTRKKNLPHSR